MPNKNKKVAAVDLGSNSFHMIIATRDESGMLTVVDKMRETVRLRAGLLEDNTLSKEAQNRALDCLESFGKRLQSLPENTVRVVGTNTLRIIRNSDGFFQKAEAVLGYPIEVISGQEEARLIYLGVARDHPASTNTRLVVDIGGGSTEFILGEGEESHTRESLEMGCVSLTQMFFLDGIVTEARMQKAVQYIKQVIAPEREKFQSKRWHHAVGCSGTIKSIRNIVRHEGWCNDEICASSLYKLKEALLKGLIPENTKGLSEDRAQILPAGLSILMACFESLGIETMKVSEQSLREGVLYDLVDSLQ